MQSIQGQLLVASPLLPDPNFFRSVVFMLRHDEQGALGVILNRRTKRTVRDLWKAIGESACRSTQPVWLGGPVAGTLIAIHTWAGQSDGELLPGVYLTEKRNRLDRIVRQSEHPYRVYIDCSGWGPGQLEDEFAAGGWLVAPATPALVFYTGDDLWERVTNQIGRNILGSALGGRPLPEDPSCN